MRILLAVLILATGTSAAFACGNPLLWAMLFAKVPEAKLVYEAELAARAEGLITARVYGARTGQPYHLWSKKWILELAKEMQPKVRRALAPGEGLTILLADEVAAIRFSHEAGVEFVPPAGLRHVEHFDLITSINALKSVWRDELSYAETVERNLVWSAEGVGKTTLSLVFASR
ncbi:hypothetical protein [Roseibium album]|uniref:hypothetical protein n=1 Tax=Roseibium album TaxID=311410 RepID=UPI00329830A1